MKKITLIVSVISLFLSCNKTELNQILIDTLQNKVNFESYNLFSRIINNKEEFENFIPQEYYKGKYGFLESSAGRLFILETQFNEISINEHELSISWNISNAESLANCNIAVPYSIYVTDCEKDSDEYEVCEFFEGEFINSSCYFVLVVSEITWNICSPPISGNAIEYTYNHYYSFHNLIKSSRRAFPNDPAPIPYESQFYSFGNFSRTSTLFGNANVTIPMWSNLEPSPPGPPYFEYEWLYTLDQAQITSCGQLEGGGNLGNNVNINNANLQSVTVPNTLPICGENIPIRCIITIP